ncbi:hypothetical protein IV102_12155 [bacterium]|nr:hypothetical protein [bacterium]
MIESAQLFNLFVLYPSCVTISTDPYCTMDAGERFIAEQMEQSKPAQQSADRGRMA